MNRVPSVGLQRSAVFASVVISLIAGFMFYQSQDEKIPFGSHSFLTVGGFGNGVSKGDAARILAQTARDTHVNLTKVAVDPQSSLGDRLLLTFVGDRRTFEQNWPAGVYPSFSKSIATRLANPDEVDVIDLRGAYASDAPELRLTAVSAALTRAGVLSRVERVSTLQPVYALLRSPLMPSLLGMLAALVVVIAYSVTHRQKIYAVKSLTGQSDARIFLHEVGVLAVTFAGSMAIASLPGVAALWFYNHLQQFTSFLRVEILILGLHAAIILVILAFAFVGSRGTDIAGALKGRRPLRNLAVFSVIAQSISFILIFVVASVTVQLIIDARSDHDSAEEWRSARDYVTVSFAARTEQDFQAEMRGFGQLARGSENDGELILAYQPPAPVGGSHGVGPYEGNSLIVNPRFLHEQSIVSVSGQTIEADHLKPGEVMLLIPQQREGDIDSIAGQYKDWVEFQRSQSGEASAGAITVTALVTKPGQRIFNYGGTYSRPQISQMDPVVAVISTAAGTLYDNFLISAASTGNVLFTDPTRLQAQIASSGLATEISSVDRASEQALDLLTQKDAKLRAYFFVLFFALLVLLFSNSILASVYCDRFKQVVFQKFMHGFSFIRTHIVFVTASLIWTLLLVIGSEALFHIEVGIAWAVATIVLLANLACEIAFTHLFQRRFRGDFVKRY